MFNLKIGAIVAASAFLLSFFLGLINHSIMPMLLVRPAIFALVFFIFSLIIDFLVKNFLPELLSNNVQEHDPDFLPGARVNIMEDGSGESPIGFSSDGSSSVPGPAFIGAQPDDSSHEIEDISGLTTGINGANPETAGIFGGLEGMDHNEKNDYNQMADSSGNVSAANDAAGFGMGGGAIDGSEDMLPDLDSMAGAFTSNSSQDEPDTTDYSVAAPAKKSSGGKGGGDWSSNFEPKEMAMGLRTVLQKDKG